MPRSEDCRYTKEHEWVHVEGDVARVGITDFAQGELGDIVYVNVGEAGRTLKQGDELGEIESVKAVAQVYAPVSGTVADVNALLGDAPEKINSDPLGEGWLVTLKLTNPAEASGLMDYAAYQAYLAESGH